MRDNHAMAGKTCIVTGASGGIGFHTARALTEFQLSTTKLKGIPNGGHHLPLVFGAILRYAITGQPLLVALAGEQQVLKGLAQMLRRV
jgi:nucleoside-diphosphate-sugar epimerase